MAECNKHQISSRTVLVQTIVVKANWEQTIGPVLFRTIS